MELTILKKRLNTFKTGKGTLKNVSNDVVMEVLRGWETWSGSSVDFYRGIGVSGKQLANVIKKAKQIVKSGAVAESEFKEIAMPAVGGEAMSTMSLGSAIELRLDANRAIKFSQVDQLVEFLKKTP